MNTLAAVSALLDITNAAMTLLAKAQQISVVVAKAQSENRDVTKEELDALIVEDDAASEALKQAIAKQGG